MEFTKSQFVLRSMDMDGRSLGTERPSTFQGGVHAGGAERFAALLATRTRFGTGEVEAQIAGRIGEGRTDAASAAYHSRTIQEKVWKPRRSLADSAGSDAGADTAALGEADAEGLSRASGEASGEASDNEPGGPFEPAVEEGLAAFDADSDASDAPAQASATAAKPLDDGPIGTEIVRGGQARESLSSATSDPASQTSAEAASQGAAAAHVAAGQTARAAETPPAQATGRVERSAQASGAKKAAAPPPPQSRLPMEEARSLLDQLRIQILDGSREARLQLRPVELGRLDLVIRVEGSNVFARIAAENPEALRVLEAHAPELRSWLAREGAEEGANSVTLELELLDPEEDSFFAGEGSEGGRETSADRHEVRMATSRRTAATAGDAREDSTGDAAVQRALAARISESGVDLVA